MTDAPSWSRVKEVFQAALERTPGERAAFVLRTCGDDVALRTEVESLLSSLEQAGSFVERPAIQSPSAWDGPAPSRILDDTRRALQPGDSLGPYNVVEFLGAGGMGQVYRARDGKLNRDVALKILPDTFATDPDRLARFRREAQVLASLNHQNIGHIYGLEDGVAPHALVLELVEGPTLADVIAGARGSAPGSRASAIREPRARSQAPTGHGLRLGEALPIALQIAEALEAAHEQGIVHRDLKPANVKVRPDGMVKVLDFGLARALDPSASSATVGEAMESPTMTSPGQMTGSGMILGTAPYMSPEQARGKVVDKRADIWAFGCVLFEMLTGRRPFDGETSSDTIAGILTREPDWTTLPAATPAKLRGLLQRCLEKDPKRRLRDIGEARLEIEHVISESGKTAASRHRRLARWAALMAVLVLFLAGVFTLSSVWRSRPTGPVQYTQITDFADSATAGSLSPDGRMVTFIRGGPYFQSTGAIYVKQLPNGEAVPLTNDPRPKFAPVFTPDGSRIAFSMLDNGSWDTWTVPVLGGQPTRLLPNASGLTWLPDGRVLFSEIKPTSTSPLHMGIVTATEVRAESREIYFPEHERAMAHYSHASPNRKWVLIVEMGPLGGFAQPCRLVPFDGSSMGREVGPPGFCRSAAWSPDGKWMYFGAVVNQRSHLWRQAFPNGTPEQITFDPTEEEGVAVAPDGSWLVTSVGAAGGDRTAVWIHDETGDRQVTWEGSARLPRLSRDGRDVYYLHGESFPTSELRRVDLVSGGSDNVLPGWVMSGYAISPDETEVAFTSRGTGAGPPEIWLASLDRRSPPRQVISGGDQPSFGPDGTLVFRQIDRNANYLYRINRDGSGGERLLATPIVGKSAVSPDGEWVIVTRAATGEDRSQGPAGEWAETVAISLRGGTLRRICAYNCMPGSTWSADGRLLSIAAGRGRAVHLPIPRGRVLPDLPSSGISSAADAVKLPGARAIEQQQAAPGPNGSTYVFTKTEIRRNLFRIQLR